MVMETPEGDTSIESLSPGKCFTFHPDGRTARCVPQDKKTWSLSLRIRQTPATITEPLNRLDSENWSLIANLDRRSLITRATCERSQT
jgi:hypothetical protein